MAVSPKGRKAKGSKAERELIHMLYEKGFASVRAAGSGSTGLPSPDIISSNGKIILALECKASHDKAKYFDKDEISQLDLFANMFGARSYIAMRFDNDDWYFIKLTDLKQTPRGFAINYDIAKKKALSFKEVIGECEQKRL